MKTSLPFFISVEKYSRLFYFEEKLWKYQNFMNFLVWNYEEIRSSRHQNNFVVATFKNVKFFP